MKYDDIEISRQLETVVAVYVPDMSTPIGRLKHLRHVVEGVPEKLFNMDFVAFEIGCGTAGCMLGHAAIDSSFNAFGLTLSRPISDGQITSTVRFRDSGIIGYEEAGLLAFGLTGSQAYGLFTSFKERPEEAYGITKAHGIARIDRLIAELSA